MECWQIVTKSEVADHRSKHSKQVTPTFAEMKVATETDITDLSKKHKHWRDSKCQVFSLCQSLLKLLQTQTRWKDGSINYYAIKDVKPV